MQQNKIYNKKKPKLSPASYIQKAQEYQNNNDLQKAERFVKKALKISPKNDEYLHFLGILQHQNQNSEDAIHSICKAISFNEEKDLYHHHLGILYKATGELENALKQQQIALNLDAVNIEYLNEIAVLEIELNQFSAAQNHLQSALNLDANNIASNVNMAHLLSLDHQLIDCLKFAKKAISLNQDISQAYIILGQALISANYFEEGFQNLTKGMSIVNKDSPNKGDPVYYLMHLLYLDNYSKEKLYEKHRSWANVYFPKKITLLPKKNDSADKKLNIGFVSSDFKKHSVPYFLLPLLENFNKNHFQIYCYSGVIKTDDITQKIKEKVYGWREIHKLSTEESLEQIKNDEIDILIDLSGHSLGNYLNLFGEKAAPIQFTFLGYPCSTGLNNIDYKITDDFADPGDSTASIHSEKLIKINPSFLCYQPPESKPITNEIPADKNKFITFGSFNNFNKLSPYILNIWSDILKMTPSSKLLLKNNRPIADLLKEHILSNFDKNNIDESRIIFQNPLDEISNHLDQYNNIDLALDSYPYNGTTTTFEALFMGVPVITLSGDSHVNRVGNSILNNMDLPELIALDKNEYIQIACNLANDAKKITIYRENLRSKLLNSPLTDAKTYTQSFENILRNSWKVFYENGNNINIQNNESKKDSITYEAR